jgi:peptidyl-prolyl cis-trans isomerase SurA
MDRRDIKPFEQMRSEITRMMARDERGSMARNAMVAKLKNDYGFSLEESQRAKLMKLAGDLGKVDSSYIAAIHNDQSVLFSFENRSYTVADFASFLSKGRDVTVNAPDYISTMIGYMADMEILDFEKAHLEDKYPDFRNLMNEYRDGMLLFEISNREVWEKASKDTEGLQKFFKKNRKKYKWDKPHYKGFLIQCCDAATADGIKNRIKELDDDSVIVVLNREFNTDSLTRVKVERGLFVEGDNEKIDELVFKGAPVKADEKLPIAFVSGKLLKKMPEAYTDVRGQVTADYQTYLEKVWVKKLNKKYPVEIYEDVLKTVNRP